MNGTKLPMKVCLTLEVDEFTRFVIAKYFAPVSSKRRNRATRKQVAAFTRGAIRAAVLEHMTVLRGRPLATAARLRDGAPALEPAEELRRPDEVQRQLF